MRILSTKTRQSDGLQRQPADFQRVVRKLEGVGAGGGVRIYVRAAGMRGREYVDEISIADAVSIQSIESALKSDFGGGDFEVIVLDKDKKVKGVFAYKIAGDPKWKKKSQDADHRRSENAAKDSSANKMLEIFGEIVKVAVSRGSDGGSLTEMAAAMKAMKAGDSEMVGQLSGILTDIIASKAAGSGRIDVEGIADVMALAKQLLPSIEPQDNVLSAILGAIPSLLPLLKKGSPEIISGSVAVSPPSGSQPGGEALELGATQGGVSPLPGAPLATAPGKSERDIAFEVLFLNPFLLHISQGRSPVDLAKELIDMVVVTEGLAQHGKVHWSMAGFCGVHDSELLSAAFDNFCRGISPELVQNVELRQEIKREFVKILTEMFAEGQEEQSAAPEEAAELSKDLAEESAEPQDAPAEEATSP